MEYTAEQYIDDVLSGKILTNKLVKLAVKRHVEDLIRFSAEDSPYYFDEEAAKFGIDFFSFLKHTKGKWAGQPVILEPWQQFIISVIYGWKKRKTGKRRFRVAYIEVARKNGKSTMFAGIGLKGTIADGEAEAEVYSAATKKDQAKIVWDQARNMVKKSGDLKKILKLFQNSISHEGSGSKFVPLSSDVDSMDGLNVSLGLIDEYHAHKNDEMYNILRSAMGSRTQPLLAIITTAGFNTSSSCKREHDYVVQLLEGRQENEEYFGIIYSLDKGDDWQDERNWIKSNPNLGISIDLDDFRNQYAGAKSRPSKINEFKTKRLNIWTTAYTRWILDSKWRKNVRSVRLEDFEGRDCYTAIDLSTTIDISGYCHCFPPVGNETKHTLFWRFFIPEENLRERSLKEDVPYDVWIKRGFVTATPGDVIDYEFIEQALLKDAEMFNILEIPYDPYNATQFVSSLMDEGMECVAFKQGITSISPAAKMFETKVLRNEIIVEDNPVMDYMIGCAEVYSDASGNIKVIKPDRKTSNKRIDGVIMAIMALFRAVMGEAEGSSVYEKRGVRAV